jgi:hypothetical protein
MQYFNLIADSTQEVIYFYLENIAYQLLNSVGT